MARKCKSQGCNAVCTRRKAPFLCIECLPSLRGLPNARPDKVASQMDKLKLISTPQKRPWMRFFGRSAKTVRGTRRRRLRVKTTVAGGTSVERENLAAAKPMSQMAEMEPEESTCHIRQRHSGSHSSGSYVTDVERLPAEVLSPLLRVHGSSQAQSFFRVSVQPIAEDFQKPVTKLSGLLADNYNVLQSIIGEQSALRLLSQFSALLGYISATEALEPITAYAAACVLVSYELSGSWEDEAHDAIKGHIRSMADNNAPEVRRCMYELMDWMGSRPRRAEM